jgi:primosomal protein N' (replication factor Y)
MLVLGPAPASVAKINNRYRYRLSLSCENSRSVRTLLAWLLREFSRDSKNRDVTIFADVNPYE